MCLALLSAWSMAVWQSRSEALCDFTNIPDNAVSSHLSETNRTTKSPFAESAVRPKSEFRIFCFYFFVRHSLLSYAVCCLESEAGLGCKIRL